MAMQNERDYVSELDALDDAPDLAEPASQAGQSATAREVAPLVDDLTSRHAQEVEAERGKGLFGSFFDAVGSAVTSFRSDPEVQKYFGTPIETIIGVGASETGQRLTEGGRAGIRGTLNTLGSAATGVEQYGRTVGLEGMSDAAAATAKGLQDAAQSRLLKARIESLSKISKESWFKDTVDYALSATGEGLGSSAPFFAAGGVAGLPGMAAFGYTTSLGELRDELKQSGVTDEGTLAKYSYLAAMPHAVLDQMTERGVIKSLGEPAKAALRRNLLRLVMSGAAREGVTEATQRVIELATVAHALGGEAPNEAAIEAVFSDIKKGTESTILESGVRGAFPGAVFGAGSAAQGVMAPADETPAPDGARPDPLARVIELDALDDGTSTPGEAVETAATSAIPDIAGTGTVAPVPAVGQEEVVPTGIAASEVPKVAEVGPGGQTTPMYDFENKGLHVANVGSAEVTYGVNPQTRYAELTLIRVPQGQRRQGAARDAVEAFVREADAAGYTLTLNADPVGKGGASKKALEGFYESLGFVKNKGRNKDFTTTAEYIRLPQASVTNRGSPPLSTKTVPSEVSKAAQQLASDIASDPVVQSVAQAVDADPAATQVVEQIASAIVPQRKLSRIPRLEDVRSVLPRDANGDPDYVLLNERMKQTGKVGWSKLTVAEKVAIYRELAGVAEQQADQGTSSVVDTPVERQPPEDAVYARFRDLLTSAAPLRPLEWPSRVGVAQEEMNALVERAVSEGLLKTTKTGGLRKGSAAKPRRLGERLAAVMERDTAPAVERLVSQATSLTVSPDVRIDRRVELRERDTGKPVPTVVTDYANRIEAARGTPAFDPILAEIKADKLMKKSDVHDLAHLVGYPVSKSTTKQDALQTVVKRHQDLLASQVDEPVLASVAMQWQGQVPILSPAFEQALPDIAQTLAEEIQRMLPPEASARVVDRLTHAGMDLYGVYHTATRELLVSRAYGVDKARETGKHEIIHVLRRLGLFTDQEWTLLVGHAKKIGVTQTLDDGSGNIVAAEPYYREFYGTQFTASMRRILENAGYVGSDLDAALESYRQGPLQKTLDETMDEERVAVMAETWAVGEARYGSRIEALLDRILKFFEALGNALRGNGFLSVDDVFQDVFSGEVARRSASADTPDGIRNILASLRQSGGIGFPLTQSGTLMLSTSPETLAAIRAYHGSPHDFDKFDLSKIGTGEGAQAFGFGLYFAESRDVADSYRTALSVRNVPATANKAVSDVLASDAEKFGQLAIADALLVKGFSSLNVKARADVLTVMRRLLNDREIAGAVVRLVPVDVMNMLGGQKLAPQALLNEPSVLINLLPANANNAVASDVAAVDILAPYMAFATAERPLIGAKGRSLLEKALAARSADKGDLRHSDKIPYPYENNNGRMYEVRINAEPEQFLDWDKPLAQQSEAVQNAAIQAEQFLRGFGRTGAPSLDEVHRYLHDASTFPRDAPLISNALREAGIPGVSYLDQGSRGVGEGSRNYVVFDDSLVEIVAKDGKPISPAEKTALLSVSAPGPEALGRTPNLDMSREARLARAEAMGFDTSKVWYHGSGEDFENFKPSAASEALGPGVYVSDMPKVANAYADRRYDFQSQSSGINEGAVYPLLVRAHKMFEWDGSKMPQTLARAEEIMPGISSLNPQPYHVGNRPDQFAELLRKAGYDGIYNNWNEGAETFTQANIFDPRNIRSVNAVFDPAEEASPLLLASIGRVGSGTPVLSADTNRQDLDKPDATLADLVKSVTRALGLTVRQGRLDPGLKRSASARGNQVMGQFSQATGVTRLALPNDLATLAHEGGHALEVRPSIRAELETLKQAHVEELTVAPVLTAAPVALNPGQGFSGLELDAETQALARQASEADTAYRQWAATVGAAKTGGGLVKPGRYDQAAYAQAQQDAATSRAALARRIGRQNADAVIADIAKATDPDLEAWVATRYAATGTPQPRPPVTASASDLSEGFAEWFRIYVTNRREAAAAAPQFFRAFEEMLGNAEPDLLDTLAEIEQQVDALTKASPVGALRSRVQSTVKPGMFQAIREEGLAATIEDKLYEFFQAFTDSRHPAKRAVKFLIRVAMANINPSLKASERVVIKGIDDFYKKWRLAEHAKAHATARLQNGIVPKGEIDPVGPSYWDALARAFGGKKRNHWNSENAELFGSYLVARRMLAEFQRFDRGELEQIPDQVISRQVWNQAKQQLETQFPDFKAAADLLYRFNRNALKLKLDNGFLTQDLYDDLIQRVDYVPLNRIMDDGSPSALGTSARGTNKRRWIYKFQGSTRDFINPLESIAQDMYATQARIALNDVIRAMDLMARAVGPGGGSIAERIPANEMKGTTVDLREAIKTAARSQNLSQSDKEGLLDIIDDLFDQDAAATIFRTTETNERGEKIVYLWEDGKKIPIRMGDINIARDIFEGFVAFGQDNADVLISVLSLGSQALRAGTTKAFVYNLINFARDQFQTWQLSDAYVPFVTGIKGLVSVVRNDVAAKRYSLGGALMGGIDSHQIEMAARKRDFLTLRRKGFWSVPAKTGVELFDKIMPSRLIAGYQTVLRTMEIAEAGTRVGHMDAAYKRALKDGLTPEEAMFEANYAAIDVMPFDRRGKSMVGATRLIPFLNAWIQALSAAGRTISGERDTYQNYRELISPYLKAAEGSPLSIAEKKALPLSTSFWVKFALISVAGAALAAWYWDDPDYEEWDDYMRSTHWFFRDELTGVWWRWPKHHELAAGSNALEAAFAYWWKKDPRALTFFKNSLKHTFLPPGEIPFMKVQYEWMTGHDTFRDRAIVPEELAKLPPELQFNGYTSELGKMFGAVFNASPQRVDHVISGLFSTLGREALQISNAALPALNRMVDAAIPGVAVEPRAETSFEDQWLLSRISRRPARGSLSSSEFWKQMGKSGEGFMTAAEGYKHYKRSGQLREARDFLDGLPDEEKAFAYLEAEFTEKQQDIHPLNRARQVMAAASGIRKEMVMGRLYKQGTEPGNEKEREPEEIVLSAAKQRVVNEILEDISMREARAALIAIGHPGWAQKDIKSTDGLWAELRAAVPDVAEEFEARLTKGSKKVYSYQAIREHWPAARDALVKEGPDADLTGIVSDVRHADDLFEITVPKTPPPRAEAQGSRRFESTGTTAY
jgi:hypothetical protein